MGIEIRSKSLSFSDNGTQYGTLTDQKEPLLCSHGNRAGSCCADVTLQIESNNTVRRSSSNNSNHCHGGSFTAVDLAARKRLITASVLCLVFMIGEIIGGYLAGSLAIMTDAAHLLTDFASFMISLFSLWMAARPATKRMSFGWYRAEVIGALTSVILIWVVTGILVYMAVERVISGDYEIEAVIMLATSGAGVGVNIIMGLVLHFQGGSHSHGGLSHQHAHDAPGKNADKRAMNINVKAALIHVVGDFLQSIGVFVAALVIFFRPDLGIMDPICTFLFSVLVLVTTFNILKDVLTVLMEGLPKGIDFNEVHATFLSIPGVIKVHNLRIWGLSMDKIAVSAHLVISPGVNTQEILKEASTVIRTKYAFFDTTLQVEDYREEMQDCSQCQTPKE